MFSVSISAAVLALLNFLGVELTPVQQGMVFTGTVIAVKVLIGIGALTFGARIMAAIKEKKQKTAPPEATKPTE